MSFTKAIVVGDAAKTKRHCEKGKNTGDANDTRIPPPFLPFTTLFAGIHRKNETAGSSGEGKREKVWGESEGDWRRNLLITYSTYNVFSRYVNKSACECSHVRVTRLTIRAHLFLENMPNRFVHIITRVYRKKCRLF